MNASSATEPRVSFAYVPTQGEVIKWEEGLIKDNIQINLAYKIYIFLKTKQK